MRTDGRDANTVTHVLGVRAFTLLLCERSSGERCAAVLRDQRGRTGQGPFKVEYADILGIPFDFTTKPVIAPPLPPRETVQVRAISPERDALEIRVPESKAAASNCQRNVFMTIPEDEIVKLHPLATYVGGRKVYTAPEANGAF